MEETPPNRRRRWLLWLAATAALPPLCLIAALASSSWWAPIALPHIAARFEITVTQASSDGDGNWELRGLAMPSAHLQLDYLRIPTLLNYGWAALRQDPLPAVVAEGITLTLGLPAGPQPDDSEPGLDGWNALIDLINEWRPLMQRWMPPTTVRQMSISHADETWDLTIAQLHMDASGLVADGKAHVTAGDIGSVTLRLRATWVDTPVVELELAEWQCFVQLELRDQASTAALLFLIELNGEPLRIEAVAGQSGWIPATATLLTETFRLRHAALLQALGMEMLSFDQLTATWDGAAYKVAGHATGTPSADFTPAIPFAAAWAVHGDQKGAELQRLEATGPGIMVELDAPVAVSFIERRFQRFGSFRITADTSRMPFTTELPEALRGNFTAAVTVADEQLWNIEQLQWQSADATTSATVHGSVTLPDLILDLSFDLSASAESPLLQQSGASFASDLSASGTVSGSALQPEATFQLAPVELQWPGSAAIQASATAQLSTEQLLSITANLQAGSDAIELHAVLAKEAGGQLAATVQQLLWEHADNTRLRISAPFTISQSAAINPSEATSWPPLQLTGLRADGTGDSDSPFTMAADFSPQEGLLLELTAFNASWLNPWLQRPLPALQIPTLKVDLRSLRPQLDGDITARLRLLDGEAKQMGDLHLDLSMAGSLSDLQMQASMQADAIHIDYEWSPGRRIPEIRDLDLQITADQQTLRLSPLQLTLNHDSRILLNGEVDLNALSKALEMREVDANWPLVLAQQFNGRLQLDQWRGEEWAAVLPGMLRPAGVLSADVSIEPGVQLNGAVAFGGFSLRPTATLPSINEINGTVQLNGRTLQLMEAGARIGEQTLTASGWLDWTQLNDLTWQLGIQGERILLLRSATMMLRTDIDLAFSRGSTARTPRVHGSLNLRNSTLLHDLDLLSGSTRGGPPRRPPYFSVDAAPMRDWELDVQLNGDAFMRVRSNYFSALLSADFHLGGTMGNPLLIGSATADSAELRFPGARMRLTHAEVFIDRDRPTVEQLLISGISERASYIVTMEVSNTLSDPRVRFQSTPSLPNASILRLLTTGSLSGSNFSGIGLYLGQGLLGPGSAESPLNRLTVDVGRDISRSGRNTIDVEFDINDLWAIEGEYDRYDAYNLDLIWKVFER